jgi:hypothetical protein
MFKANFEKSTMRKRAPGKASCLVKINFNDVPRIQVTKTLIKEAKNISFCPKHKAAVLQDELKSRFHYKPSCLDLVYEFIVHRMQIKRIAEKYNRSLSNTYKIIKLYLTDETVKMPKEMRISMQLFDKDFIHAASEKQVELAAAATEANDLLTETELRREKSEDGGKCAHESAKVGRPMFAGELSDQFTVSKHLDKVDHHCYDIHFFNNLTTK